MEKSFSGSAFAAARDARRCSGFVHTAIADNAIAARRAAPKPGAGSTGRLTAAISRAWKADSTTGIGKLVFLYGENGSYDYMFAAIACVVVVAFLCDRATLAASAFFLRWHDSAALAGRARHRDEPSS